MTRAQRKRFLARLEWISDNPELPLLSEVKSAAAEVGCTVEVEEDDV